MIVGVATCIVSYGDQLSIHRQHLGFAVAVLTEGDATHLVNRAGQGSTQNQEKPQIAMQVWVELEHFSTSKPKRQDRTPISKRPCHSLRKSTVVLP